MKKLMTFCFVILCGVLSALSCFNFAFDALDRIEEDKISIVIEKPESISNTDFLAEIDHALETANADIMLRCVENVDDKAHYQYFKTNHTTGFLDISTSAGNNQLENSECISTTVPVGYTTHRLNASSLMQDISFFPWADAEKYDLSAATYYVKTGQQSTVVDTLNQLGYAVTINPTTYISGKFSVLLFGFVPAFMLVASMAFYILSSGKKNVLKKMASESTIVFFQLAKLNQTFVEEIESAENDEELSDIRSRVLKSSFISYKVNPRDIDAAAENYASLSFSDKKRFLMEILDKNFLYVNYCDIDDKEFAISDEDKAFTKSFYKEE